jgi:hypothetical protein
VLPQVVNSPMYYSSDKFRTTRYNNNNASSKLPEINEKNNN